MIKVNYFNDNNKLDTENYSKIVFNDLVFNSIGYIDAKNFVVFFIDKYSYCKFLDFKCDYRSWLAYYIDDSNFYNLSLNDIFLPDIFKNKIGMDQINLNIDKTLKMSFQELYPHFQLRTNISSDIFLNPKFIQNLQIQRDRMLEIGSKIRNLSDTKKEALVDFFENRKWFIELNIKINKETFKKSSIFLNLFNTYYSRDMKFNNGDVINLIRAIYRNIPKNPETFKLETAIYVYHNGIDLKIYRSHIWHPKNENRAEGYKFTIFDQKIDLNKAINFLKMAPNFDTFLYQLEKIHLSKV